MRQIWFNVQSGDLTSQLVFFHMGYRCREDRGVSSQGRGSSRQLLGLIIGSKISWRLEPGPLLRVSNGTCGVRHHHCPMSTPDNKQQAVAAAGEIQMFKWLYITKSTVQTDKINNEKTWKCNNVAIFHRADNLTDLNQAITVSAIGSENVTIYQAKRDCL